MPDLRALLVSAGVGAGIAAFTILFWRWPLAMGIGAGILLGGLALTGTISIGHDAAAADAAWRAAAPDLLDAPTDPLDVPAPTDPLDVPAPTDPLDVPAPTDAPLGGRDLPSGA